jgi:type IV secretory pathway VirB4 component
MLRLDKVIKPWKDSAALNAHINLYGFWNETAFLTKSGDVGMVLSIPGVDYESLDRSEQEYAVKRLEAALKAFGPGFHVYQYLFKSNRPDIPFAKYDDPIVEAAIDQRRKFFEAKRDHLYQVEIFYCILLEGARSKTGVGTALSSPLARSRGRDWRTQIAVHQRQHEDAIAYAYRARSSTTRPTRAGIHSPASRSHANRSLESRRAVQVFPPFAEL